MTDRIRVFAGDCTADFDGIRDRDRTSRGIPVALVKPDNTVLIHDSEGYSPVAWLTCPLSLTIDHSDGTTIEADDGEQRLHIRFHELYGTVAYPGSVMGVPVGTCAETSGTFVRSRGSIVNIETSETHSLPAGAVVLDECCEACGLSRVRVERGKRFEVCLDRTCESLEAAVTATFDRAWSCPACTNDLHVLYRGGLIIRCASRDCATEFAFPRGTIVGACDCGLPVFETDTQRTVLCSSESCEYAG